MYKKYCLLLALSGLLCHLESATAHEPHLTIGVLTCLTSECSDWGTNSLRGIELAVEEVNSAGGVLGRELRIAVEDTAEAVGGTNTVSAFRKLSQSKDIKLYIGPTWTPGGLALAPIVSAMEDIIMISPSVGVPDFHRTGINLFNTWPADEAATRAVADFAIKRGWQKGAVFSSQQPWSKTQGDVFASEFTKQNGLITSKQEPLPSELDLRVEAQRIRNSAPDFVFFSNLNQMGLAARQLRQQGYKGPILTALIDDVQLEIADGALDNAVFARYARPEEAFVERYRRRFGSTPQPPADSAYDALHLYVRAIEESQSIDVNQILPAMLRSSHHGASGPITFDEMGGIRKSPVLYVVRGRETMPLEEVQ